ncbi:hypothetical protein IKX64_03180 [Candidatus Saccharibacteria bacterium]|nr:hypothetical protein [Candidatus Saccharibacteria bacterium]
MDEYYELKVYFKKNPNLEEDKANMHGFMSLVKGRRFLGYVSDNDAIDEYRKMSESTDSKRKKGYYTGAMRCERTLYAQFFKKGIRFFISGDCFMHTTIFGYSGNKLSESGTLREFFEPSQMENGQYLERPVYIHVTPVKDKKEIARLLQKFSTQLPEVDDKKLHDLWVAEDFSSLDDPETESPQ